MKNILIGLIAAILLSGCTIRMDHLRQPTIVEKRIYVPKYVYKTEVEHVPTYVYKTKVKYVPHYITKTKVRYVPRYITKTKVIYKHKHYSKKKKTVIYRRR